MTRALTAKQIPPPPRKVRLTPAGLLVRSVFLGIMLVLPGILALIAFLPARSAESRTFFLRLAAILFVITAIDVAFVEWYIARERRRLREWAVADVVMWEGRCHGLMDLNGRSIQGSPPINSEALATGQQRTVLYDPHNSTLLLDVHRPLQVARIEI
jgi:hypothetical protein